MTVKSIWIIGPSASGKSTLARLLCDRLRGSGHPCILLDGDEVRAVFETKLGYDPASRRRQTRRIQALARLIMSGEVIPVVAIIHPFEDDRLQCRKDLPGYFEVYLKCDMKELIRRDAKKLYLPALRGEKRNVIGVDIPFDSPGHSDVVLASDALDPQQLLDRLWTALEGSL